MNEDEYSKHLVIEPGIPLKKRQREINTAEWLICHFGGTIIVKKESTKELSPDYDWDGMFWELKTISTEKAADSAVRKGIKQIMKNPGGIILDCRSSAIDRTKLLRVISNRVKKKRHRWLWILILYSENEYEFRRY